MLSFEHAQAFTLRVNVQASTVTTLDVRGITREGSFTFKITTVADQTIDTFDFRIPDFPILLSVSTTTLSIVQGQIYAAALLVVNGDIIFEFCSGLIYGSKSISYPSNNTLDQIPGGGQITQSTGFAPADGANASITITSGQIWRVHSVRFQLTTNATVANRRVHLVFEGAVARQFECFSDIDQTASLTRVYFCAPYGALPDSTDDIKILVPIPDPIWMTSGTTIDTSTVNLQAGDVHSGLSVQREAFFRSQT